MLVGSTISISSGLTCPRYPREQNVRGYHDITISRLIDWIPSEYFAMQGVAYTCSECAMIQFLLLVKFIKHNQNYYLKRDVVTSIVNLMNLFAMKQFSFIIYCCSC